MKVESEDWIATGHMCQYFCNYRAPVGIEIHRKVSVISWGNTGNIDFILVKFAIWCYWQNQDRVHKK